MKRAGVILHAERDQAVTTARALVETLLSRGVGVWALDGDADRIGLRKTNRNAAAIAPSTSSAIATCVQWTRL